MKNAPTTFLKIAVLLIAVIAINLLLLLPRVEGRAANLNLMGIYTDPFVLFSFVASIPFFVGLYQAFTLLNLIDANKAFSQNALQALKNIKIASLIFIGFILSVIIYIRFFAQGDDPAGPTVLGIVISFASLVIGTAAAVFEKLLKNALDLKSENDLTV